MSSLARERSTVSQNPPSRALTSANSTLRRSVQRTDIDRETEEELLFLTDISRPVTQQDPLREDFDNFRLELTPTRPLEPHEVRQEIYRRECTRLGVIPLSSYLRNPIRNSLLVPHCGLGPRGAMALAAPLLLDHNIVFLDIEGNAIGPIGLNYLMEACLETMSITQLNLSNNCLGTEGAKILCEAVQKLSLFEYLDLSNNEFKDEDSVLFADVIEKSKSLREVILAHNHFAERAGHEFGRALANNDRLEAFDLSWNHINGRSAEAFAKGVKKNVGLKRLDISFNGFGREGSKALSLALKKNRTLQELDLSYNRMVDEDIEVLAQGLMENETLKTMVVGDNLLTHESSLHILRSIEDPKSLTVLENVDLKNVCVDQEFVHLLQEVKEIRIIDIKHGKVMNVGKPRRRRRRRKPKPKPEADKEKDDVTNVQPSKDNKGPTSTIKDQTSKEGTNTSLISDGGDDKNNNSGQVLPLAPPPGGIVREPLILGQDMVNKEAT